MRQKNASWDDPSSVILKAVLLLIYKTENAALILRMETAFLNLAARLIGVPKPNGNRSNLLNKICVQPRIQATAKPSTTPQHTCMGVCPKNSLSLTSGSC